MRMKVVIRSLWMILVLGLASWRGEALELAKDGKTDYVIVCGNQGRDMEVRLLRESAADLAALLKQSTGADFRIVEPREAGKYGKRIFVGHSDAMLKILQKAGKYRKPVNEERILLTLGDDLFLYGGGFGDGFAVSHFLTEVLGFRFYHYWGDSRIPEYKTLKTDELNIAFRPSFEYRDLAQSAFNLRGCGSADAARRQRRARRARGCARRRYDVHCEEYADTARAYKGGVRLFGLVFRFCLYKAVFRRDIVSLYARCGTVRKVGAGSTLR